MYTDDSSGSEDDDYSNSDGEECDMHEQRVAEGILNGSLVVKNSDDTFRCPLSPGRKKQSYKYREILAHAQGVIVSGKRSAEKKGGHRALVKYLQAELRDKPMIPQAPRVLYLEQAVPKREATVTKLLAPWMGVLVNIDNTRTNEKGFRVAAGAADIKEKFKVRRCKVTFWFSCPVVKYFVEVFVLRMFAFGLARVLSRSTIQRGWMSSMTTWGIRARDCSPSGTTYMGLRMPKHLNKTLLELVGVEQNGSMKSVPPIWTCTDGKQLSRCILFFPSCSVLSVVWEILLRNIKDLSVGFQVFQVKRWMA